MKPEQGTVPLKIALVARDKIAPHIIPEEIVITI
jgi:hypothetical protein